MLRRFFLQRFLLVFAAMLVWVVACQPQPQPPQPTAGSPTTPQLSSSVFLNGTGAEFPFFLYQRWFSEYSRLFPTVQINYQPTGSEAGIQQMVSETIDFAGSDVAMVDEDISKVKRGVVLLPMTSGSVAISYNLPGIKSGLKLSRQVYPEIFLGKITRWNDPKIQTLNSDLTLPDLPITVAHRSDGSGTTAAFTRHLSAISPEWKNQVGEGLNVNWIAGVGIKSNSGVSAQVQQAEGAIGYVEYAYAKQLNMASAALENKAGNYVLPSTKSAAKALSTVKFPDDLRVFVPDPNGAESYPIVTYSWLLAYQKYDDPNKAKALKDVIRWGVTQGQKFSEELGYVPLFPEIVQKTLAAAETITP
jgi:phosphate transport system substrate-binding protein